MSRNTNIATRAFSDAGAKEIKATWDSPAIWKTGDTGSDVWAALWVDRSDTNYKLRVKYNLGGAPTIADETDGQAVVAGTTSSAAPF